MIGIFSESGPSGGDPFSSKLTGAGLGDLVRATDGRPEVQPDKTRDTAHEAWSKATPLLPSITYLDSV